VNSLSPSGSLLAALALALAAGSALAAGPPHTGSPAQQAWHFPEAPKDSDGDGISDLDDNCPNTGAKEAVDGSGCPIKMAARPPAPGVDRCSLDSDHDGVNDCQDKCPGTYACHRVGPDGCPVPLADSVRVRLEVKFDLDEANIQPGFEQNLSRLRGILLKYPEVRATLEGHTDTSGPRPHNQELSEHRANSCRDFVLEGGGIDPARVKAVGYGPDRPIASNNTHRGRKLNRRMAAEISFDKTVVPENDKPPPLGCLAPEKPPAATARAATPVPAAAAPPPAAVAPPLPAVIAPAAGAPEWRYVVNVKFGLDRADIEPGREGDLPRLREILLKHPDMRMTFEGHTDSTGLAPRLNKSLSQRRADACRDVVLRGGGIAAGRVTAIGYGQERPVATNKTFEGRKRNRRIVAEVTADKPLDPAEGDPFAGLTPEKADR
jgi:outer membrane protein OmpA-like peptidoglycan-associated protein